MLKLQSGTIARCHKYLDNMGTINQRSVASLPKEVKEFLRQVTPKRLKELAQMNCFAANKLKEDMDKTYGANNYIIIAIGRSISSITETLGRMGTKVKILPLSRAKRMNININPEDDNSWEKSQWRYYKTFLLCCMNLSKYVLKQNKDKKYIIMDYAYTGGSIKKAEELLKREDFLDNPPNLSSKTINDVLKDDFYKRGFRTLFHYHRFKNYSYVGELKFGDFMEASTQSAPDTAYEYQGNITQGLRKLFWFNVFDSIQEQNYKHIVPQKELNAVGKHNLSDKVIQKFIKEKEEEDKAWITILKEDNASEDKIAEYQEYHSQYIQNYIKRMQEERQFLDTALNSNKK